MQFALSALAFSGAVLGSSILERQVTTIVGVVNQIEKSTTALDTAVKGYNGDPSQLLSASKSLMDIVSKGVSTVKGASSITLTDSVSIQGQVSNLQSAVEAVVSDLIAKKEALVSSGQAGQVEENLKEQLAGAKDLAAAISSKVPPEVQSLAQTLSAGITTSLQKGVDAFAGSASSGSSGSGSGSSAGESSSSSGSSGSMAGMPGMAGMSGMSGTSGSSSGSAASGSSYSGSSVSGAKPAVYTSAVPKPATYTGAASYVASSSVAGLLVICAAIFAL